MKGEDNVPADVLSCMQTNALLSDSPPVIDFKAMAAAQESDPDVLQMRSSSSLTLKATPLAMSDSTILCDTSTWYCSSSCTCISTCCVQIPSLPLTPRHPCYTMLVDITLYLTTHQFRCLSVDSLMSEVPACQGSATHRHTISCIPGCISMVRSNTY